ncbi:MULTISPECIES: hypothetical protein [Treponema]|jgi:hypothetical protein|uniref:Uncharacterized protein n=1 Tax=Treponema saccharophilum DSM 2985 TaxID=907348 RepID=H7EPA3_9SPIR|nr:MULTISPECIES: hypothetical protein [Treponema]EIC00736.1 hypothetical protein TresaDRAFT_0209 [Treponema saccharophilum DSM 2985]MBQ5537671.1 hypothetical protein [Treponema sp.]BDC95826.1 hypothetical protein TRSA_09250 [Treponema saccharophilum]
MAIAPIDLQTIYAQMGHLAKVASDQQNGERLSQQLQEAKVVQQNLEKSKTVSKAADNESKTMIVGKDGKRRGGDAQPGGGSSGKDDGDSGDGESLDKKETEIRETYLGNHVNIVS